MLSSRELRCRPVDVAVNSPPEPIVLPSVALGLLVTFRTNTTVSRYNEARCLWATGAYPQSTYGHQVTGNSPSALLTARRGHRARALLKNGNIIVVVEGAFVPAVAS